MGIGAHRALQETASKRGAVWLLRAAAAASGASLEWGQHGGAFPKQRAWLCFMATAALVTSDCLFSLAKGTWYPSTCGHPCRSAGLKTLTPPDSLSLFPFY